MADSSFVIATDVGGTFTDTFLTRRIDSEESLRQMWTGKAPTTPGDEGRGILASISDAVESADLELTEVLEQAEVVINGSTVATNVLAQLNGARVGLITTAGFEDTIPIARSEHRPVSDFRGRRPLPELVPTERIVGLSERVDHAGEIVAPLERADAERAVRYLVEEQHVEAIAVCLLWSFTNPVHEQAIKEVVRDVVGEEMLLTVSSDSFPVAREYERMLTTVLNAYTSSAFSRWASSLENALTERKFSAPILVMQSHGGVAGLQEAVEQPVQAILSGPAGGVRGASHLGELLGERNLVIADMGGTSFDVSLIREGEIAKRTRSKLNGFPTVVESVDIDAIGAGGGSIAWVDDRGVLQVGPHSAGADPGPVCYGREGERPTVTDAALVLGLINSENFLGGRIQLDMAAAERAIGTLGETLGTDLLDTARGIYRVVSASMSDALRTTVLSRGHDPADFTLLAYGGASPLFAANLTSALGMRGVVIPPFSPQFSAFGLATSNIRRSMATSFHRQLPIATADLEAALSELQKLVAADLSRTGHGATGTINYEWEVEMRFALQAWEVTVPVEQDILSDPESTTLVDRFQKRYENLYGEGTAFPDAGADTISIRVIGTVSRQKPDLGGRARKAVSSDAEPYARGRRPVHLVQDGTSVTVLAGESLDSGIHAAGPLIIERSDTAVYVPDDFVFDTDDLGNLRLLPS